MSVKKNTVISPAAVVALKEALTNIYWYKNDLQTFLIQCLGNQPLLNQLDWKNEYKRNIVERIVTALNQDNSVHKEALLKLMREVSDISDFSHLLLIDDGEKKAKVALSSVESLRKLTKGYFERITEQEEIEIRKKKSDAEMKRIAGITNGLEKLKLQYFELLTSNEPQNRGYSLEKLITELFNLFDLDSKASFKIVGEQIDGAFTFDSTDFLFEAKWTKELIQVQDLDAFASKVNRRLDNTLGLFLSINGFSKEAIPAHSSGRKVLILFDGNDLMAVLESRIDLKDLLYRKRRYAAQTGNIFLSVSDILVAKS